MRRLLQLITAACFYGLAAATAQAGMPSPLPTRWTATSDHPSDSVASAVEASEPFLEGISFFVAAILLAAWAFQGLWHLLRRDLAWLPTLKYRQSLGLVVLWGLLFIVVLTMISGARELMTPGAWRKQGWTYKLASTSTLPGSQPDSQEEVRHALEDLRQALWQYAATHDGKFPRQDSSAIDPGLWEIPGWPGLRFLYVAGRHAEAAGQILVYAPELEGDDRPVLMTNGMIGHLRSTEIHLAFAGERSK